MVSRIEPNSFCYDIQDGRHVAILKIFIWGNIEI